MSLASVDMDKQWEGALALLRSQGFDADEAVRQAAENIRVWRQAPREVVRATFDVLHEDEETP